MTTKKKKKKQKQKQKKPQNKTMISNPSTVRAKINALAKKKKKCFSTTGLTTKLHYLMLLGCKK